MRTLAILFILITGGHVMARDPDWVWDGRRPAIDDPVRAASGATFFASALGHTRYEVSGPEHGPRVLLVHGASGPMEVWDHTVSALRDAGFRVARYDLFGRGLSDRPKVSYDLELFDRQLTDLRDHLGWDRVHLVGSSMGCIIATEHAARHPEAVDRVALIGPAGFPIEANPLAALLRWPITGNVAMTALGDRLLASHNMKYYFEPEKYPEAHQEYRKQFMYRGYKRAILSTMRHMPMNDFSEGYRALGASGRPIALIWGREDRTFPYSHFAFARSLMPAASAHTIDRAAHVPQYEKPQEVGAHLIEHLAR